MEKGWFDKFSSQEIDRQTDSSGVVSYSVVTSNISKFGNNEYLTKSTKNVELLEVYFITLKSAKKELTPELKQVIDDFNSIDINSICGQTEYAQKPPLGHAIDQMNLEAVEYLFHKGADVNVSGTNQKHILQELLASNATDKRVQILEMVLPKLKHETISLTKGFDGKFYTLKYLVPLINSGQLSESDIELLRNEVTPKQKKTLIENCEKFSELDEEKILEESIPQDVRKIFMI